MDVEVGCTGIVASRGMSSTFMLNMTSDAAVRQIVDRVGKLGRRCVHKPPDMGVFTEQFDPEIDEPPFLPFNAYVITGTAGAGKSTSVTCLYHALDCLVTGATAVASQNLSQTLRTYCPTVYSAFGFKSRHINMVTRMSIHGCDAKAGIEALQRRDLSRYWPVLMDIMAEFMHTKRHGMYTGLSYKGYEMLRNIHLGQLWTTNIIVVDEAGTLSTHVLTAVVFCYWFFNAWLGTPLFRRGLVPCVVCVGSPTQTDAFQSCFSHVTQVNRIRECDNILTFLIADPRAASYVNVWKNWALFINNKRCVDMEFGHLLKILEYGLELSEDILSYLDRFVVPHVAVVDPHRYVGWTRLFLSHAEVKQFLTTLHAVLKSESVEDGTKLFTCPVVCDVGLQPLEQYRLAVGLGTLTATSWLQKNYSRLGNYSQFADQDMVPVRTEMNEEVVRVTFNVTYVRHSSVAVNGKTRKTVCGYDGTFGDFAEIIESDSFVERHGHEKPEYVYGFLARLIYCGVYAFSCPGDFGVVNCEYQRKLKDIPLPCPTWSTQESCQALGGEGGENGSGIDSCMSLDSQELVAWDDAWWGDGNVGLAGTAADVFYSKVPAPPSANSTSISTLLSIYNDLKVYFGKCLKVAITYLGNDFANRPFCTFTSNIMVRDGIEYTSYEPRLHGLLDFASSTEDYTLLGYTHLNVFFGRGTTTAGEAATDMPHLVVRDEDGFVCCLEHNVNKLHENVDDKTFHLCSIRDYGVSSKLAMTIAKAQGLSLNRVAISFGKHKHIKPSHVYVALSRARYSNCVVMDRNPLSEMLKEESITPASKYIVDALKNPSTLLVY
ncbi:ORF35 [callitrichine gammaherpesvirus 3]|uniref:ORF35 n=1 Tax=callitrichine gammaherpesvirus 3 TaxID=106331 RepID=Q993H5_9GAMA|nr:ORF35 [callitrichine gammaherpesvirus 3]AAK38243.1 ORF35 [callitrichine gammaherpesvirus 3]